MSPETAYECDTTFRPNTIFPTGAILEPDGEVEIYYGAADNSVAVATASVERLLAFCLDPVAYEHPRKHPAFQPPLSRHA
jgi:beta-1,4-mannooligosaccharide/beta-1,4-mannosyl-N-acetylglucosamine phosphorylase